MTRGGRRIYWGADREPAIRRHHEMGLGSEMRLPEPSPPVALTVKELANRFLTAQRANWRNPTVTLKSYKDWLGRSLADHPRLRAADCTVEAFANWKLSMKERDFSAESINPYLVAVRAMFRFAEDAAHSSPQLANEAYTNVDPAPRQAVSLLPISEWL